MSETSVLSCPEHNYNGIEIISVIWCVCWLYEFNQIFFIQIGFVEFLLINVIECMRIGFKKFFQNSSNEILQSPQQSSPPIGSTNLSVSPFRLCQNRLQLFCSSQLFTTQNDFPACSKSVRMRGIELFCATKYSTRLKNSQLSVELSKILIILILYELSLTKLNSK